MDKDTKFIKKLCYRIRNGKFAWERYQNGGTYYGREIQTQRVVCSYGICGFDLWFLNSNLPSIQWDWDLRELTINEIDIKTWLYWDEHYMVFWDEWAADDENSLSFAQYVTKKHGIEIPNVIAENW